MIIVIHRKSSYGSVFHYVQNEPAKTALATLTGKKTLNARDIEALRQLGHEPQVTDVV